MNLETRSKEIAEYLGHDYEAVRFRLEEGFHQNHFKVAEDFRAASPTNDDELLEWYRSTDSYIYELTAYHLEPGFNYTGMCDGIVQHVKGIGKSKVLVLGDGVGDLTLALDAAGLEPTYNDLDGSKTAGFAQHRFAQNSENQIPTQLTKDWTPKFRKSCADVIVALDFFEHLTEVELWVRECSKALKKNGQFMAQNAFAIGDDEHGGSIPMHLTRNNRFEHDWVPLLTEVGLVDQGNGWWVKP